MTFKNEMIHILHIPEPTTRIRLSRDLQVRAGYDLSRALGLAKAYGPAVLPEGTVLSVKHYKLTGKKENRQVSFTVVKKENLQSPFSKLIVDDIPYAQLICSVPFANITDVWFEYV